MDPHFFIGAPPPYTPLYPLLPKPLPLAQSFFLFFFTPIFVLMGLKYNILYTVKINQIGHFLPMVPEGGTMGQQMDFFFSFLLLLLLLLLLLDTTKFLFLLGTEHTNFQTGLTFQATPVTPISSCSFSFYFLE